MAPPPPTDKILSCIDKFLDVQSQRAAAYQRFDEGFRNYLNHGAEGPYRYMFGQLTPIFQDLSSQVKSIEQELRDLKQIEPANAIRELQNCESVRLRITLQLQSLKSAVHQEKFHWQHEARLAPGSEHAHQCSCVDSEKQATKADVDGALGELYTDLESNTREINELLLEIRQFRADIMGSDE